MENIFVGKDTLNVILKYGIYISFWNRWGNHRDQYPDAYTDGIYMKHILDRKILDNFEIYNKDIAHKASEIRESDIYVKREFKPYFLLSEDEIIQKGLYIDNGKYYFLYEIINDISSSMYHRLQLCCFDFVDSISELLKSTKQPSRIINDFNLKINSIYIIDTMDFSVESHSLILLVTSNKCFTLNTYGGNDTLFFRVNDLIKANKLLFNITNNIEDNNNSIFELMGIKPKYNYKYIKTDSIVKYDIFDIPRDCIAKFVYESSIVFYEENREEIKSINNLIEMIYDI